MEISKNVNEDFMHFVGSENIYEHDPTSFYYTDGIKDVAEKLEAYWLIDEIFFANIEYNQFQEPFQVWTLQRAFNDDKPLNHFCLIMDDGNRNVIHAMTIPYSDFKGDTLKLYFENETLLLPSER